MANFKLIEVKEDGNETGIAEGSLVVIKEKVAELETAAPAADGDEDSQD